MFNLNYEKYDNSQYIIFPQKQAINSYSYSTISLIICFLKGSGFLTINQN